MAPKNLAQRETVVRKAQMMSRLAVSWIKHHCATVRQRVDSPPQIHKVSTNEDGAGDLRIQIKSKLLYLAVLFSHTVHV